VYKAKAKHGKFRVCSWTNQRRACMKALAKKSTANFQLMVNSSRGGVAPGRAKSNDLAEKLPPLLPP